MQITINNIRNAVNDALDSAFPNIPISDEESEPELNPPYFFVRLLEPTHRQELGRRYRRDLPFDVRYFDQEHTNEDMYNMAEQLTEALKWITIGSGRWPGQSMRFQIIDGVLHFYVTYSPIIWEQQDQATKMQTLEQEGTIIEK